jgi:hypothetical protein
MFLTSLAMGKNGLEGKNVLTPIYWELICSSF